MDLLWRTEQSYPFTFQESVATVGELRERRVLPPRFQSPGHHPAGPVVTLSRASFSVLQRWVPRGDGFWIPPSTGLFLHSHRCRESNTDTGRRARNQADGANGEQQPDRWHGNTDSTRNLLERPLTPHGKLWETFYLFRNHFGMTVLLLSHPPQLSLDNSLEVICHPSIKTRLLLLLVHSFEEGIQRLLEYPIHLPHPL